MNLKPLSVGEHHRYDKHPYYIFTPPYNEKSAGIRVLHYLCNILNVSGYEAYINTPATCPHLWTPTLSNEVMERHFSGQKKPIVIYPEIVVGAPLNMGIPVRYLLNQAGKIAGHALFSEHEIQISYRSAFSDEAETPLLTVPCSDPSVFYPPPPGTQREGRYVYFSRLLTRGGELQDITNDAIEISPRNPMPLEELPALFRKAELLYCYEDGAITLEARMCGCPIAYIPNPSSLPEFPKEDWGTMGAAWGTSPEQIEHAKQTVGQIYPAALKLYDTFAGQLRQFIGLTQSAADQTPLEKCYASLLAPHPRDMAWLKAHDMQEVDGQIWAERLVSTWGHQPSFHFFIIAAEPAQAQLADTLEHLSHLLYPHWQVTVIADFSAPDGWNNTPPFQWLALRNLADADYVLNEMAATSPCDWLAEIQPGTELKPFALLATADHIHHHPNWQWLDADEYVPRAAPGMPSLRMNAGFDLDFLRGHNHLGGCVMVRRQAWMDVGRFGNLPLARTFDLALKIHDRFGLPAMGHIPHVLTVAWSDRLTAVPNEHVQTQERQALADHFSRRGIGADIQAGSHPHTRHFHPTQTALANGVTFVIPIAHALEMHHPTVEALCRHPSSDVLLANISGQALELPPALASSGAAVRLMATARTQWPQEAARHADRGLLFFISPFTTAPTPPDMETLQHTLALTQAAVVTPALCGTGSKTPLHRHDWPHAAVDAHPLKAHCTHTKLAATGLPLLVSKDVLLLHGGWDLAHHTLADALVDFSARLGASGHKVVWTPHVTLHPLQPMAPAGEADNAWAIHSRQRLLGAHLGQLAQAAEVHPDLLLQTPQALRHQRPLTWNTHASERPRVLVLDAPREASDPFATWLDKLRDTAAAVVLKVNRQDIPTDVLTIARLAPHVIVMNASPAPDAQALMREVKACLPHICVAVNVDALECMSDAEQRCTGYRQRVLEACTHGADQLITFSAAHQDSACPLSGTVQPLGADSPMPLAWKRQAAAPIAQ